MRLSEGEEKERGEDVTKTPNHKPRKFREY